VRAEDRRRKSYERLYADFRAACVRLETARRINANPAAVRYLTERVNILRGQLQLWQQQAA